MLSPTEKREFDKLKNNCYTPEKYNRYVYLYKKLLNGCTDFKRTTQGEPEVTE